MLVPVVRDAKSTLGNGREPPEDPSAHPKSVAIATMAKQKRA
jgi:hypothetical protein